jgi:uncharacterized membrane protein YraQ (UPF0718 family)
MVRHLLHHRHEPDECGVVFASFKGHHSPLVRRGASFTAAMAFEIAGTSLVIEFGIILALLLSWQFTLAEFTGGPIMIVLMAVAFRLFVRKRTIAAARAQADKGLAGAGVGGEVR